MRPIFLSPVLLGCFFHPLAVDAESANAPKPTKLIQGFYQYLYDKYKPEFRFSPDDSVTAYAAVAYVFLAGHRDEYQGRELSSPMVRKSIEKVLMAQTGDGGFAEHAGEPEGSVEATASAILALRSARNPDYAERTAKASKWLELVNETEKDPVIQLLAFLALKKDDKFSAEEVTRLVAWAKALRDSPEPEYRALGLAAMALARLCISSGVSASEQVMKDVETKDQVLRQAAASLADFQSQNNVLGACIAVRALHYCSQAK